MWAFVCARVCVHSSWNNAKYSYCIYTTKPHLFAVITFIDGNRNKFFSYFLASAVCCIVLFRSKTAISCEPKTILSDFTHHWSYIVCCFATIHCSNMACVDKFDWAFNATVIVQSSNAIYYTKAHTVFATLPLIKYSKLNEPMRI